MNIEDKQKMVKQYHNKLNDSLMNFHLNPEIEITEVENNPPISKKKLKEVNHKITSEVYSVFDGCSFKWNNSVKGISGSLDLQSLKDSITDQWTDMVTDVIAGSQKIENYRIFDLYSNQNHVGFFIDDYPKNGLFYVRELDAYKLNLDMESYFILAVETMGLMNWPSLIINWEYNLTLTESKSIEKQLINGIPNFDIIAFKKLYEDLKF